MNHNKNEIEDFNDVHPVTGWKEPSLAEEVKAALGLGVVVLLLLVVLIIAALPQGV